MRWFVVILLVWAVQAQSDIVVPVQTLAPGTRVEAEHLDLKDGNLPGTFKTIRDAVGLETQVALYAKQPIFVKDLAAPTLVARNQQVVLLFERPGLTISAIGRALARGRPGQWIKVMNNQSKQVLIGQVRDDGKISVSP